MTVAELIRELQTMPQHLPAKVVLTRVATCDELGDHDIELNDDDAENVDDVRRSGGFVLIKGR